MAVQFNSRSVPLSVGGGATQVFNYTTFTGATPVTSFTNNGSGISGGLAYIAQGIAVHQGGALWNTAQVNVQSFTTNFTFALPTFVCTLTAGSANITIASSNNGLAVGQIVKFGGVSGSVTGVSPFVYQYFVVSSSTVGNTTTIQVSTTSGGSAITMGGSGTDTVRVVCICGMSFSIQTSNNTTNPLGPSNGGGVSFLGDANLCGFGAYSTSGGTQYQEGNSVVVKLDMGSNSQNNVSYGPGVGQAANAVGLYVNGGPFNDISPVFDLNPYGFDLGTGDLMSASLVYDGNYLVMLLENTVTNAQARFVWPLPNLTSIVGGNTAWVGMTCGMIPAGQAYVASWNYYTGYNTRLVAPSFSPVPGVYSSGQSVTISAPASATIYYSTNGLPPTTSSTQYTGPISVSATQNLQAIAVRVGYTDSFPSGGVFQIASGAPKINFPSGFSTALISGQIVLNGFPFLSGSAVQLLQDSAGLFQGGSLWYSVPQPVATFTTSFTFTVTGFGNSGNGNVGFTFCLQNYGQSPSTYNTPQVGGWVSGGPSSLYFNNGPSLGYAAIANPGGLVAAQTSGFNSAICVAFDLSVGSYGGVGVYSGATTPTGSTASLPSTMNLPNGHAYKAELSYNGTTLSLLLTDTITSNTYSNSWNVNIPVLVGGSTAYAGFTAATGYSYANIQLIEWIM